MARFGFAVAAVLLLAWPRPAPAQNPLTKKMEEVSADHAAKMAKGTDLFKKKVRGLIEKSCLRCHGGKSIESEFDLSDREGLLKGGLAGPAVVPGKAKDSLLVKLIHHQREPHMPYDQKKLPADALAAIVDWIELGAPYDDALVAGKAKKISWTDRVLPASAKDFWSFKPLMKTTPPEVKNAAWCRTPLDRFVLSKLEAAGVAPNPPVSNQLLLRRVYLDLIGLPPTPEEADAFLNDTAPDAYEKLIDRLLASSHYGERWARHWLDLARFAESHGFEHDTDRPSAYHYRDFVIEALNRDLPYDQFVKWQIAGDEYAPDNNLALKATGFLAAGVHSTQITKNEVEKHRYDEMDDKLATLSTAFLGLTVGCARCHDHKFDPIPQRDYYRLLSTFTSTVRSEVDLNLDPEGYRKAKAAFDQAHAPFVQRLREYEENELPGRLAAWEKDNGLKLIAWEILETKDAKSKEGATLTPQADGSILATGKNEKFDSYTIVAATSLKNITSIRLEALADPNLVKGGPGRAANGNFALSDFQVTIAPVNADAKALVKPIAVKLKNPRATFEQKGLPSAAAIDKDSKSAWAVDPQFGKDHAAVFETDGPVGFEGGSILTFTLTFNNNAGHNLGRPRLSLSSDKTPDLLAMGIFAKARAALQTPAAERKPEQAAQLLTWYRTVDAGWRDLEHKRLQHLAQAPKPNLAKALIATEGLAAVRLHTQGEDLLPDTHFLRRGDPDNKEGVATQSFLQVLMPTPNAEKRWRALPPPAPAAQGKGPFPKDWRTSYQRRALAEWLTDVDQGAGHLLARVIVNRLWQHHLGRGIVATPSDFGKRGEPPTHPELLDYLAQELIKNGWRLKPIHKLILTSAVYVQSAQVDEAKAKIDRDNKLFWRKPARRLEAEIIRDCVIAVGGELDKTMYGPGTLDPASKRRSIYFTVKRSKLVPMMVIFDAPEALSGMAERPTTTIAPQALHLLNNPQVRAAARGLARRAAPSADTPLEKAVEAAYRIALTRLPTREEAQDALAFLAQQTAMTPGAAGRETALTDFCHVLFCLNEFVYVD
ncbi:MAG: PSD1 and planctomycete cytochrome C domain-containing protein [Gemmataceae bacterium]|nr:PSD1 and planctomycete cytochrome C domain-containing protein [Gemmataceae bacterium]MCI0740828.1 PSD1 and planctomycete cytochrome C domain-containing protein [Gemmataceae bacterium]